MGRGWQSRGLCRDVDPELLHPLPKDHKATARAKKVCSRCPVRTECLEFALARPVSGIWAGTTEDERRAIRQSRRTGHEVA